VILHTAHKIVSWLSRVYAKHEARKWNFEDVERKKHTIPFKNVFLEENQIHFIAIDDI